jgi:DNA invertase Pin-like site-specific DNA recombinase
MTTKEKSDQFGLTNETTGEIYSYERWSSAKQDDGDSERRQLAMAESWCQRKGLKLSEKRFVDRGVSAYRGGNQKAELGKLFETIKAGDTLLVEDADRLSRQDWLTAMDFLRKLLAKGVKVVTLQNGLEITEDSLRYNPGCFIPAIMNAHLGNAEDRKKSERVRAAWVTKHAEIREGTGIRQRLPGWLIREKVVDANGKVTMGGIKVNESKAETVRLLFKLALNGWGCRRIAQKMNADRVPSVSGQMDKWNGPSLKRCILNSIAVIGHYSIPDPITGKPTGEIAKNIFPAIVSEKDFYAVQALSGKIPERSSPVKAVSNCLVTGLTHCPTCGGPMAHQSCHSHGKIYPYLICSAHKAGQSKHKECAKRIKYGTFEQSFLGVLCDSSTVRKALGQVSAEPSKLTELRGRIAEADKTAEKIWRLIDGNDNPPKKLVEQLKFAEIEGETLRGKLQAEELMLAASTSPQVTYETWRGELAAHAKNPERREQIKQAIRDIVESVQFHSKNAYRINFKGSSQPVEVIICDDNGEGYKFELAKVAGGPLRVP